MKSLQSIFLSAILLVSIETNAQTNKALNSAFIQSYELEATKNYEAAINSINAQYSANSYEMNLRLGWLNYLAGKHKESVNFYEKASKIMPAAIEPLWGAINPLTRLESWSEIEKIYGSILKIDQKNTQANYYLGLIYYYRKDYIKAKKQFDVVLNLYPFNYNYMLMSAWTNYFLGNKNEASILFNKTLLYTPNDKSALEGLSLIK